MSFFKSIKNAFGGSDEEYDVFGQPTTFVNPFSKDKNVVDRNNGQDDVEFEVQQHEEYAIDAEYADKAVKLMNEHTQVVIDSLKGSWKAEREELLKKVEEAEKVVEEYKEKMQVHEASRKQAQNRANDLSEKIAELEAQQQTLDNDKKSLENRIRLMETSKDDTDELNEKLKEQNETIEDLKAQLAEKEAEIERRDSMPLPADDGPTIEQLNNQIEQRDELIERLRGNISELEERLNEAAEELKDVEALQKTVAEVQDFKDKKNSEISSLRQQIIDLRNRASEFDEIRKANIVLQEEKNGLQKTIEQLEQTAKQTAEVQHRRSIETGNLIDGLKEQLAAVSATAEDYRRKYNSLSVDGNEKAASFAKITAERDDAKAELKRTQVTLQKKQHEAQAMSDAIAEKDRVIAALKQQVDELGARIANAPAAQDNLPEDPALKAIDDIDWDDDGSLPPHPGEDPRQLSLF